MDIRQLSETLAKTRDALSTQLENTPLSDQAYYFGKIDAYSVVIDQLNTILKNQKVGA